MITRRNMLIAGAGTLAGAAALQSFAQTTTTAATSPSTLPDNLPPGEPRTDYTPVITPNTGKIPWKLVGGVKVFHLVAQEFWNEFAPGLRALCWGYNGIVHPVLEAVEGDRLRIYVTNRIAAPTTVHWHGFLLPSGMDGVGGLSQRAILEGETFMYEFTVKQHGTLMFHSHHDEMTQIGLGMTGMFIIHPRNLRHPRPDRDFVLMLHEWRVDVGASRPNPNEMTDFNLLTMNAKAFPATYPLVAKKGERVRIRIGNLSPMDHHPIHLHGYQFRVIETDGGEIPEANQWPETTVLVAVGQTRTIEFIAEHPGDWAMHCHMTHHVMNQMGHEFPNVIGVKPGDLDEKVRQLLPAYMTMGTEGMADMAEMAMKIPPNSIPMVGGAGPHDYITMGGMFTILKVRESLDSYDDPGWYAAPEGTQADLAIAAALNRDGVDPEDVPPVELGPGATVGVADPATEPATQPTGAHDHSSARPSTTLPATAAATVYTCRMHKQIVSDKPGKCPICGMKLIPKK